MANGFVLYLDWFYLPGVMRIRSLCQMHYATEYELAQVFLPEEVLLLLPRLSCVKHHSLLAQSANSSLPRLFTLSSPCLVKPVRTRSRTAKTDVHPYTSGSFHAKSHTIE